MSKTGRNCFEQYSRITRTKRQKYNFDDIHFPMPLVLRYQNNENIKLSLVPSIGCAFVKRYAITSVLNSLKLFVARFDTLNKFGLGVLVCWWSVIFNHHARIDVTFIIITWRRYNLKSSFLLCTTAIMCVYWSSTRDPFPQTWILSLISNLDSLREINK